jgi:hypothetical protein
VNSLEVTCDFANYLAYKFAYWAYRAFGGFKVEHIVQRQSTVLIEISTQPLDVATWLLMIHAYTRASARVRLQLLQLVKHISHRRCRKPSCSLRVFLRPKLIDRLSDGGL